MNYEKDIKILKERIDRAQIDKVRAETRLEQLEKERDALLAEMQEYGIKPEDLDKEIARLDKEVGDLLQKAAELLPEDE
ncbi:MAG: hypothetical protein GX291_08420 [Tissierellia bacterium]|jgi:chromosome segregation ATPase|nr:hypothetical protein [Bacillota bacterium]NLK59275.1 hypothetical protein [Tissierellia bacterium]